MPPACQIVGELSAVLVGLPSVLTNPCSYERFNDPDIDVLEASVLFLQRNPCTNRSRQLSRNEELNDALALPVELEAVKTSLRNVTDTSDAVLRTLFSKLCASLQPPIPDTAAVDANRPGKSNLGLGVARAAAGTALMSAHADDGLLTILYHITPFIEAPDRSPEDWALIEMAEGLHIVNVGDALTKLSAGRLKSAPHRIIQAEGPNNLITYYLHQADEMVPEQVNVNGS